MAILVRRFGDIDVAEEAVQEAVRRWPDSGIPPSPAGWIITTVRHQALDRVRRQASRDDRQAAAADLYGEADPIEDGAVRDERLRLIFRNRPLRCRFQAIAFV